MKCSILVSTEEILPKAKPNKKKRWITDDIVQLMEQRRLRKSNLHEYELIDKEIIKKCSEAKEKRLNEQCSEIENKLTVNSKYAHKKIDEITMKTRYIISDCIKSKSGIILRGERGITNRWSEYIEELFNDNRTSKPNIKKNIGGP